MWVHGAALGAPVDPLSCPLSRPHVSQMYVFCLFMRVLLSWFPGIDWNAQPWTFLRLVGPFFAPPPPGAGAAPRQQPRQRVH